MGMAMHFENAGRPARMRVWLWSMVVTGCMVLIAPVASADDSTGPADCSSKPSVQVHEPDAQGAPAAVDEVPAGCAQPGESGRTGKPASPGPTRNKSLLREYLEDESYGEGRTDRRKLLVLVAPQRVARA
jgi:hypothetical protein